MRGRWLLLLAVLCFPTFTVADTIDFGSSGHKPDVTVVGKVAAGSMWSVTDDLVSIDNSSSGNTMTGPELGTVNITSGTLVKTAGGFSFTGGSVDIKSETGATLFEGAFSAGTITKSKGSMFLNATLMDGGTTEIAFKDGSFSSNTIVMTTVPEVPSLLLLGSGLVGLWWMGREHLMSM